MSATDGAPMTLELPEILAASESCQVYRCAGGCIHVRVGSVTLHVQPRQYRQLVETLVDASLRMELRGVLQRPAWRQ